MKIVENEQEDIRRSEVNDRLYENLYVNHELMSILAENLLECRDIASALQAVSYGDRETLMATIER